LIYSDDIIFIFVDEKYLLSCDCRKRSVDASASEIDQVMRDIFQILMNISREFLHKSGSGLGSMDESEYEFSECICESMVSPGSFNLQSIAGDSAVFSLYLEQVINVQYNSNTKSVIMSSLG
jgi:hypothetical protein